MVPPFLQGTALMTSDTSQIRLFARLAALEILVQHLLVMVASGKNDPVAQLRACRNHVLRKHSQGTIKGVEPRTSDLVPLTEALDALLSEAITEARESRPPQSPDFSPRARRQS
jgi:hypothetical protein